MEENKIHLLYLDGIDKSIIRELLLDSRTPIQKIARKIKISGPAIHQRIRKLESKRLIIGSSVKLNSKLLGYKTLAFIGVFLDKAIRNPEAVDELKKIPEILECH